MTPREPGTSASADQTGDDFQKIAGIGQAIERRLHDAGILTYQDLAARSPEQIAASLAGAAGISSARIASQDWAGQAGRLAGPAAPPLPSEPDQRYASFHIELLLDVDGSVRRTKVHHHQSGKDEAWPGWDEGRLITLLSGHIPVSAPRQPAGAPGPQSSATPATDQQETAAPSGSEAAPSGSEAAPSGSEMDTAEMPVSLPSSVLRIENLGLTHAGQRIHRLAPGEPTAIGFTLHVTRASAQQAATFDFTADVTASSELGDGQRQLLGTVRGAVRAGEPLPVELAGPPLPRGLYRLEATVAIYPADHAGGAKPLHSCRMTGAFAQVADGPVQPVPART